MKSILKVLIVVVLFAYPLSAQSVDTTRTISVNGIGEITVTPDICIISAGVISEGSEPEMVMNDLSLRMNKVLKALEFYGVKKQNIKTTSMQLFPIYDYDKSGNQYLKGYRAQSNINVRCEVKDAGKILATIVNTGVNNINSINFDYSKRDSLELAAIELAVKDARTKAEKALSGTGYRITGIKSINIQSETPVLPYTRTTAKATMEMMTEVPIEEGEMKVRTNVFIIFSFQ